jgi:hypothetical protein
MSSEHRGADPLSLSRMRAKNWAIVYRLLGAYSSRPAPVYAG